MHVRHVRNGVELPDIIRDDHYDFNFQVSRYDEDNTQTKECVRNSSIVLERLVRRLILHRIVLHVK